MTNAENQNGGIPLPDTNQGNVNTNTSSNDNDVSIKLQELTKNLQEQGRVLKEFKQKEELLFKENQTLKLQLEKFEHGSVKKEEHNYNQDSAPSIENSEVIQKLKTDLELLLAKENQKQEYQRAQQFNKMADVFHSFNIKQDEYESRLSELNAKYEGVDLFANPNPDLLRTLLVAEKSLVNNQTFPPQTSGAYQYQSNNYDKETMQKAVQSKVMEFLETLKKEK